MAVITISREPGTFGEEVAARLAGLLGFFLVDKARLAQLWKEMDLDEADLPDPDEGMAGEERRSVSEESVGHASLLSDLLVQLAEEQDLVIIGRGSQVLFRDRPGTLHVRIVASRPFRIRQLQVHESLSLREATQLIKRIDAQRAHTVRSLYGVNWTDPKLYDLTLRMDRLSIEQALNLIAAAVQELKLLRIPRRQIVEPFLSETEERSGGEPFVNEAEREFARFLNFYRIPYQYEPRTFTLETDAEGRIVEAFTPDFYLPEQDLYIELTTMKQSLVIRKNRKVRKLRQLHPEINIRIFYQRDFRNLVAKRSWGVSEGCEP